MEKLKSLSMVVALATSAIFTACSSDEQQALHAPVSTYTLTVDAVKADDGTTRALALDGKTLNATWGEDDMVQVYKSGSIDCIGTLKVVNPGEASAKLSGTITTTDLAADDELLLYFPTRDRDYSGQDGTLDKIATSKAYASATVKVSSIVDSEVATTTANFENQQAIVKFTLKDTDGNDINASQLNISAAGGKMVSTVTTQMSTGDEYNGAYVIRTEEDWNNFADKVNGGSSTASAILGNDVTLTNSAKIIGNAINNMFSGTFDGNGHTLTVNMDGSITFVGENGYPSHMAPFGMLSGCTIKNLKVTGTMTGSSIRMGLASYAKSGTSQMINVWNDITFNITNNTTKGWTDSGAFIGKTREGTLKMTNCLFTGQFVTTDANELGGFVGCAQNTNTAQMTNCLFAPSSLTGMKSTKTVKTWVGDGSSYTLTNCYYTTLMGTSQGGTDASSMSEEELVSSLGEAWEVAGGQAVPKLTSVTIPSSGSVTTKTNYATTGLTVMPASATNEIFVALSNETVSDNYLLTAFVDEDTYIFEKKGVQFQNGKYYAITVKMKKVERVPGGAIHSKFSVAEGKTVYFSMGNLQYQGSTGTWRFAENQYNYAGEGNGNVRIKFYMGYKYCDNRNIAEDYDGWIDLFGWGTSGYKFDTGYGEAYQPWSSSSTNTDYGPSGTYSLTDDYITGDWGINMGQGWRTLTGEEWEYLLKERTVNGGTGEGKSFTWGQTVTDYLGKEVKGLVLYPDNYTGEAYTTGSNWSAFEDAGCVFLPAAGKRVSVSLSGINEEAYYWSSSCATSGTAMYVVANSYQVGVIASGRCAGCAVRLVCDAK